MERERTIEKIIPMERERTIEKIIPMERERTIEKIKVLLKECKGECKGRGKTVHTQTRNFNEVDFVTVVNTRCEICGNHTEYKINHDSY